ncbi:fatty acyl-CoA hydrolase precursor, medium chain-like isoform X2 [Watersipora subatra]|uniref:fatty acyl-CoA hydrolase precursor, medium chain-like isoform X2 n=1 Tax=Watersipora subatra TaxID=2589382 RepID=UPI00355BEB9D
MNLYAIILVICLNILGLYAYWDKDRELVENPQHDNANCDSYCKKGIPSYINWREGMDYRERQGIDRIMGSTKNGPVEGFVVPGVHDTSSFVNVYLGIPYAEPPVGQDMFKPARQYQNPWIGGWDASFYRPACPQVEDLIQQDIPDFTYTNEDCLHINIFQPNVTNDRNSLDTYPVLVFIHGGGFTKGSAIQYPGIVLAQRDMVVVTFNYRLGPYGFLSTEDSTVVSGNMGLSDQVMALHWVQDNIDRFRGRPHEVTLVGHEAGAACVGILMLSPIAENLFHRAILMSGSDMNSWAVMNKTQAPKEYARQLAEIVGCEELEGEGMIKCLRSRSPPDIVNAAEKVSLRNGHYKETAGPFAPTVDSYDGTINWLRAMPVDLRENPNNVMKIDVMGGFAKDEGAWILNKNFSHLFADIETGVTKEEFKQVIRNVTVRRRARDEKQVQDAIEFLYTWWVNPDNSTARRKMLIDVFTDELYASGVDITMKSTVKALQNTGKNAYMYKFDYRSETENASTYWMGAYHNYDVQYLFGWPYLAANTTYQKLTSIKLDRQYSELDRNISNGTMQMWKDFAKSGNPTQYPLNPTMPWNFRNLTWYPMNVSNLTYFELDYNSTNEKEYHQSQLAFWQDYIFDILYLEPYTTTPIIVTAYAYESYQIATYALGALLVLTTLGLVLVSIILMHARGNMPNKPVYL